MSGMDALVGVLGALAIILAAIITARAARKLTAQQQQAHDAATAATNRIEQVRVDGVSYDRAAKFTADLVDALREEVTRLQGELNGLREQLHTEQARSRELDEQVRRLQRSVNRLQGLLVANGIPLPESA